MSRIYTGIGSRETPFLMLEKIIDIACRLADYGWTLRSGGADGADKAFETGCDLYSGKKEIYLPWKGFNENKSKLWGVSLDAFQIASGIHPTWNKLSQGAKLLHGRNVYQILGKDLKSSSDLVICWTKGGKKIGGSRTALILAEQYNVPIINLCTDTIDWSVLK